MDELTAEQRRQIYEEEKKKDEDRRSRLTNRRSMGCLVFVGLFLLGVVLIPIVGNPGGGRSESPPNGVALPTQSANVFGIPTRMPGPTPTGVRTFFGDGAWLIGPEVLPGTYRTIGPSSDCYWARLVEFSNVKAFIERSAAANESGVRPGGAADQVIVVWIRESDTAFETSGCGVWRRLADSGS